MSSVHEMILCLYELPLLKTNENVKAGTELQTAWDDRITPPKGDTQ